MYRVRKGIGDTNPLMDAPSQGASLLCALPSWLLTSTQLLSCTALPATSQAPAATSGDTTAVASSSTPGAAAQALVNNLATQTCPSGQEYIPAVAGCVDSDVVNFDFSQVDANLGAPNAASDPLAYFEQVLAGTPNPTPFCGTGSVQWITGIDNCVLLIGGAVVGGILLASLSNSRRRR
jgi:hypothetical protein